MSKPIRVQRKRTKGWKMPENTVYVGRPSIWGNPFIVGRLTPTKVVKLFRTKYADLRKLKPRIKNLLKGKNLACWCKISEACHADILLKIANE